MASNARNGKVCMDSDHARIPASACWYTAMRKDRNLEVHDTLQSGHWIKTHRGGAFEQEKAEADLCELGNIGSLDVAGCKKVVGDDTKKEYDIDDRKGMPEDEAMTRPALFGRSPKVYNVNQGDINDVKKFIGAEKGDDAELRGLRSSVLDCPGRRLKQIAFFD